MKGDFSRLTGIKAKRKHYNQVLKQQGRVQLDSDWNELISIIEHQRKTRTIDTIGSCGAPIHNSGFKIFHPGGGLQDLLISSGRFYAGGLLGETTPSAKLTICGVPTGGGLEVDDTKIEGVELEVGQWVQITSKEDPEGIIGKLTVVGNGIIEIDVDTSSFIGNHDIYLRRLILFSNQIDYPHPTEYIPIPGQTDLVYLDIWERHITPVEDPELREVALGGPDTDTRSKIITQVKVLPNVGDVPCEDEIGKWNELIKSPNGRLTTGLVDPPPANDPCQLGESGGYLGLENHLYRVEIHHGSNSGTPTFKWSRDNAAFAYGVQEFFEETGGAVFKISLKQNGKDEFLKIKQQDWIEVSGDETDLDTGVAGTLAKVTKVEGNILTLNTDISAHKNENHPKIRRWEISNQRPNVTTNIVAGTGFQLEDGIEIIFSGTAFNVGDYWVFSARTLTGEIEMLDKEAPMGIKHHYCKLALVFGETGGDVDIEDCRPEFPPLTELPDKGGCCTVTVGEDGDFQDIQLAIDSLNGGPGEVCIKPGVYEIDKPIIVIGKDITIKGCGGSPIIINRGDETQGIVFQIIDSWDIHIHDIWCLSIRDTKVIEVENSLFCRFNKCIFVGGGSRENGGVITFKGLTIDSRVEDNLILGIVGIRYEPVAQDINLHLNTRAEKNIIFALEYGVFQAGETNLIGYDLVENLILGIEIELLAKAIFPEGLFEAAEKSGLYKAADIKTAKATRKTGPKYEGMSKDNRAMAAYELQGTLKVSSTEAKANTRTRAVAMATFDGELAVESAAIFEDTPRPTQHPILTYEGYLVDGNISDNILIGNGGITTQTVIELVIDRNIIFSRSFGIASSIYFGLTIDDNLMITQQFAIGSLGQANFDFTAFNNKIISQTFGVIFSGKLAQRKESIQVIYNTEIENNIIFATAIGIGVNNEVSFLTDFTVVDNSIVNCSTAGIALISESQELQPALDNNFSFQRTIQRNSLIVTGTGIITNLNGCKILDNNINSRPNDKDRKEESRGILLRSSECIISNNTIQAITDNESNEMAFGGIYIDVNLETLRFDKREIDINHNKILGGIHNGIEIASELNGLVIESNQILGMGLNGIAVQEKVSNVNNLIIKGNRISDCLKLAGETQSWWKYAGIVLTSTRKTQIIGNVICDNRFTETLAAISMGAFYAEYVNEISISNNHFVNNGRADVQNFQPAIFVPIRTVPTTQAPLNSDIQITNNIVKSGAAGALSMGSYSVNNGLYLSPDQKAIITNNQFESTQGGALFCAVVLSISECVFLGNYISSGTSGTPVYLLGGKDVMASNNVASGTIIGIGLNQQIINNLQIS